MRFLLDTHVFLWWINGDDLISNTAYSYIEGGHNELFLSVASGWEIAIKAKIGKLTLPTKKIESFITQHLFINSIIPLPIYLNHALNVYQLPEYHRDPFDRMIISQAMLENIPIITADSVIAKYPVKVIW